MCERELDEFALSSDVHLHRTVSGSSKGYQRGHGTQLVRPFSVVLKRVSEIRRGDIVATNHISDHATRRVFHTVDEDAEFYARSREARYDSL